MVGRPTGAAGRVPSHLHSLDPLGPQGTARTLPRNPFRLLLVCGLGCVRRLALPAAAPGWRRSTPPKSPRCKRRPCICAVVAAPYEGWKLHQLAFDAPVRPPSSLSATCSEWPESCLLDASPRGVDRQGREVRPARLLVELIAGRVQDRERQRPGPRSAPRRRARHGAPEQ